VWPVCDHHEIAIALRRAQVAYWSVTQEAGGEPSEVDAVPRVPFVGLARQHEALSGDLHRAFDRVLEADAFILGSEVEAFEHEFADYCHVPHCVGVASGTAALTLALLAAGIGVGDEVIVPGHTFIASALAVMHAGATPVFCDVESDTGLIDSVSAQAVVTERTAAIMPVHLYGQACDMQAITALACRHGLFVLEDAAQAHGASWRGERVGGLGNAAAFSFYPSKNLGALGEGGAVCTRDGGLAGCVAELRNIGQRGAGEHVRLGYNERLHGLQAAFLRAKLPHLDRWNLARRVNAALYRDSLPRPLDLLGERPESPCVYHLFPCRHVERNELARELAMAEIQTKVHYSPAAHSHPAFDSLPMSSRPIELPTANAWAASELSLPMFAELTEPEIARVAEVCQRFVDQRGPAAIAPEE
jgi:dTDP-3-amino-3,4,6-trideoxy-alpha-D-glucose transaminase